jgi:predicted Co/Zn/Cd cation transporter (cation efflux family)
MSRLLTDEQITLLVKGFVLALLATSLLNLVVGVRDGGGLAALSGALVFVYMSVVLAAGVFADRLFAPRVQIALFAGLTAYWMYDYLERDTTLSILLVVFGLAVIIQQGRRLLG